MTELQCHLCNSSNLHPIAADASNFIPVSSDTRIVRGQIRMAACDDCRALQKIVDTQWREESSAVYRDYEINHQASGSDPYIFNSLFGDGPRADILLKFLTSQTKLPSTGKLLDVGCANGNILRSFHKRYPSWEMYGLENSRQWESTIRAIPGVKGFYTDPAKLGEEKYDLIIMSHVLEHIPDPATALRNLASRLAPGGKFLIAVPNIRLNPIDLFVLDHCTHFDDETLAATLARAGMAVTTLRDNALPKELLSIFGPGQVSSQPTKSKHKKSLAQLCADYITLSAAMRDKAASLRAARSPFGIMGTATAAIWLTGQLPSPPDFYVDEDPQRVGKQMLGKPIHKLADVPEGATVFIPMPKAVAERIISRAPAHGIWLEYIDWDSVVPTQQTATA